ncbi:phage antirepressor N-terminal domain-containing protein [Candidatus Leptofilum sp.]|uniref:phage antirepressor N-terminal domain-containing protein n=1 Tax=Candidatus Leptofilum sp. TaxID=3241576 RepID=UPI003B5BB100
MADKALVPIEQKEVLFYDDEIPAVLIQIDNEQDIYIPLRPICDHLGLDWSAQTRRVRRDPILSKYVRFVAITATNPEEAQKGGNPNMFCLPLDYLNGFLFGISANRVKEELRDRVLLYQERCYKVLYEAFQEGRLTATTEFDELLSSDTPAAQAYKMAQAIMQMARQQLLLESRLDAQGNQLIDHEQRLEEIEATLGDTGRFVTPDQAMQISQAIKTIAGEVQKRTGRNEYGKMYGQLYREFGITSYKQLPASKFNDAMVWLTNMFRNITGATGDDVPF